VHACADEFVKDTTTWRWVSADSSDPLVTVRSSSEHGPAASGVGGVWLGATLAEGVTVTVTVEGDDGAGAAVGLVCWAEHPAIRTAAINGKSISFMGKACGRRLGGFLVSPIVRPAPLSAEIRAQSPASPGSFRDCHQMLTVSGQASAEPGE
jgi:hypothetical protein